MSSLSCVMHVLNWTAIYREAIVYMDHVVMITGRTALSNVMYITDSAKFDIISDNKVLLSFPRTYWEATAVHEVGELVVTWQQCGLRVQPAPLYTTMETRPGQQQGKWLSISSKVTFKKVTWLCIGRWRNLFHVLTRWSRVMHLILYAPTDWTIIGSSLWLVFYSEPGHYLNQYWLIINGILTYKQISDKCE